MQALAALHGGWLVLLVPPTVGMIRLMQARRLRLTGIALTMVGVLGLTALTGHDLLVWFSQVPSTYQRYFAQRILYALAVGTDLPLVQLTVVGLACWVIGKKRGNAERGKNVTDVGLEKSATELESSAGPLDHPNRLSV